MYLKKIIVIMFLFLGNNSFAQMVRPDLPQEMIIELKKGLCRHSKDTDFYCGEDLNDIDNILDECIRNPDYQSPILQMNILHLLCRLKHIYHRAVSELIYYYLTVNPTAITISLAQYNYEGLPPLHLAALKSTPYFFALYLKIGADINQLRQNGESIAITAIKGMNRPTSRYWTSNIRYFSIKGMISSRIKLNSLSQKNGRHLLRKAANSTPKLYWYGTSPLLICGNCYQEVSTQQLTCQHCLWKFLYQDEPETLFYKPREEEPTSIPSEPLPVSRTHCCTNQQGFYEFY